jgi:hypothetical protein
MLQERQISRRDLLKGALGLAGAALVAGATTEGAQAAPMTVETTQSGLSVVKAPTLLRGVSETGCDFLIPTPKGFNPDNGEMKNCLINEAPRKEWFHPKGQKEGTWSYNMYFAYDGEGELVDAMTGEGFMAFRQKREGDSKFMLGIGVLENFKGQDLRNQLGENPTVWLRTHPFTEFRFWNPDTCQPIMRDGAQLSGTASDGGDIGFVVGKENGRVLAEAVIPHDPRHETFIRKGNIEDFTMNHVDLRMVKACTC